MRVCKRRGGSRPDTKVKVVRADEWSLDEVVGSSRVVVTTAVPLWLSRKVSEPSRHPTTLQNTAQATYATKRKYCGRQSPGKQSCSPLICASTGAHRSSHSKVGRSPSPKFQISTQGRALDSRPFIRPTFPRFLSFLDKPIARCDLQDPKIDFKRCSGRPCNSYIFALPLQWLDHYCSHPSQDGPSATSASKFSCADLRKPPSGLL